MRLAGCIVALLLRVQFSRVGGASTGVSAAGFMEVPRFSVGVFSRHPHSVLPEFRTLRT